METTTVIHTFLKCREQVLAWCPPSVELSGMQSSYLKVSEPLNLRSDSIKILSVREGQDIYCHIFLSRPSRENAPMNFQQYVYLRTICTMTAAVDLAKWIGVAPQDATPKWTSLGGQKYLKRVNQFLPEPASQISLQIPNDHSWTSVHMCKTKRTQLIVYTVKYEYVCVCNNN